MEKKILWLQYRNLEQSKNGEDIEAFEAAVVYTF
jgi:hypothetical protein